MACQEVRHQHLGSSATKVAIQESCGTNWTPSSGNFNGKNEAFQGIKFGVTHAVPHGFKVKPTIFDAHHFRDRG